MSVKLSFMTVTRMLSVTIPLAVSSVPVNLHSLGMEKIVKVGTIKLILMACSYIIITINTL